MTQLQMEISSFLAVPVAIPRKHKQRQGRGICVKEEWQAVQRWTKAIGSLYTGSSAQFRAWRSARQKRYQKLAPNPAEYRTGESQSQEKEPEGQVREIKMLFRWESSPSQGWMQGKALCAKDRCAASCRGRRIPGELQNEFWECSSTGTGWGQNIPYSEMARHFLG